MRTRTLAITAAAIVALAAVAGGVTSHLAVDRAGASVPSAIELADNGLSTVVGPDDEGSYALIDPIGPGGVMSTEASDEVYASTLQGGKYTAWQPYRDPFAPAPNGPPAGPYPPAGSKPYGGGGR
jgi:hypothetical protein